MRKFYIVSTLLIAVLPFVWAESELSAGARRALIVGNAAYSSSPLKNSVNDARDMASLLRALGFSTSVLIDADRDAMSAGVQKFVDSIQPGDTALFYYSGHGFQLRGSNYLIPVGAGIKTVEDIPFTAVSVDGLLAKLSDARSSTNIVVLDACRNNPFPGSDRALTRGLANESYPVPGTIVVYSTSPGAVASECDGRNGVFTGELLKRLRTPGLDIEGILRLVRDDVIGETGGTQIPWSNSSLRGSGFCFMPRREGEAATAAGSADAAVSEVSAGTLAISYAKAADALVGGSMLRVEGGSFLQGATTGDDDEKPVHETILGDYFLSLYETSYSEYDVFCEAIGREKPKDAGSGRAEHPVAFVTWYEACEYCNWRSKSEGFAPAYEIARDESGKVVSVSWSRTSDGYRLPTEAEWEYAARGGKLLRQDQAYPSGGGLDEIAWFIGNSKGRTASVGTKSPNALGIYDLAGNVWEWCWDWYGPYSQERANDPTGADTGKVRILRGGGYNTQTLAYYSVSNRGTSAPVRIGSDIGFRIARSKK